MTKRKREPRSPSSLPATTDEIDALKRARDFLSEARRANFLELGDPFSNDAQQALVRRMLRNLADFHPRNAARVLSFAMAGVQQADEALKDLIAERQARGEPLWPALATYGDILANEGSRPYRRPEGRQMFSPLANFVVVCLIIDLKKHFGHLPLHHSTKRHRSICALTGQALTEVGLNRGSEEAIWKIWRDYGPPVVPGYY
jgi:hypothetical protein